MYFFLSQEHKKSHKQKITLAVFYYVSSVHKHIFFSVDLFISQMQEHNKYEYDTFHNTYSQSCTA